MTNNELKIFCANIGNDVVISRVKLNPKSISFWISNENRVDKKTRCFRNYVKTDHYMLCNVIDDYGNPALMFRRVNVNAKYSCGVYQLGRSNGQNKYFYSIKDACEWFNNYIKKYLVAA